MSAGSGWVGVDLLSAADGKLSVGSATEHRVRKPGLLLLLCLLTVFPCGQMTSTERILAYSRLAPEASLTTLPPHTPPPSDWPQRGAVEFKHLSLSYTPDGQLHSCVVACVGCSFHVVCCRPPCAEGCELFYSTARKSWRVWSNGKRQEHAHEVCLHCVLPLTVCVCVCSSMFRLVEFQGDVIIGPCLLAVCVDCVLMLCCRRRCVH